MLTQSCCAEWVHHPFAAGSHVTAPPPFAELATMSLRDTFSFLGDWTSDPRRVGAIAPSGRALARLITAEIDAGAAPVIELGAGTGVFTRALVERGLRPQDLCLVEYGDVFANVLRQRFPGAHVHQIDAARLGEAMLFDGARAGAVVSGLPLLNMSTETISAILQGAFSHLRDDGAFYQFTYGWRCPVPASVRRQLDLHATHLGRAWWNLPPAAVWRIERRHW
jgi:phospholipid N-methyltransferase